MTTIPSPPRLTGNPKTDVQVLQDYSYQLYNALIIDAQIINRLDAIARLGTLDMTVSSPPTQAEVQAVAAKLDGIILAAQITN